ncbi:MAG: DUF3078 domain-containing protein [Bacteroidetes bacterium]|jgi:hypothetical protein|nr:DUF3078 domain-containing protein [Bacteroidota bacterium]
MKRVFLITLAFVNSCLFAQHLPDSLRHWHRGGAVGLNFTQTSFTNWATGGENSVSGQGLLGLFVNYKKDSTSWDNSVDFAYGVLHQGKDKFTKKTDDKIDFTSKYGRYAFKKVWYYTALFSFKTQSSPGYIYSDDTSKTVISDFMAPGYTLLALGLDYKPNKTVSVFFAPFTGKTTYVLNQTLADAGAFGVDKAIFDNAGIKTKDGQNIRNEFGGYVRFQYKAEVMTNITLNARCELFSNYLKDPQNIDVNAEIILNMKVNKYFSANLNIQGVYDNDVLIAVDRNHDGILDGVGPRFQLRQVLGVGFSAKF